MAKKLTAVAIESAKPGPDRREISDGGSGLWLVVQPSGAKSWAVRYRFNGKPRKLTLGKITFTSDGPSPSLATARKQAAVALEKLAGDAPIDPAAEKSAKKREAREKRKTGNDQFAHVVETYLKRYESGRATRRKKAPKERTLVENARLLGMQRVDGKWQVAEGGMPRPAQDRVWGKKRIQDIAKRDVRELLDSIVADDRDAPYTANRTYAALYSLFAWAVRDEIITVMPVMWDKAPEEKRERVLSDNELRWFWKATEGLGHPFGPLFRLLALTGQRRDEVAAMTEHELDFSKRQWAIPGARTKNRREHIVPLSDAALDVLEGRVRIKGDRRYLFTTNGESAVSGFSVAKKACEKSMLDMARKEAEERGEDLDKVTIPQWQLHDLRRTVSTKMHEELGIEPHIVEAVLNHVSGARAGVAGVYNRAQYITQKTAALQAWGRWLLALVEAKKDYNVIQLRGGVS
jgi:integrase